MLKFRRLKDHIVNSKRNSQLLHQQELFNLLQEQCSLSRINISLNAKLQAEINQITPQDYKIYHQQFYQSKQVQERSGRSRSKKTQHLATEAFSEHKFNRAQYSQDYLQTAKKGHLTRSLIEGSNFTKIIDLMKEVNDLQRRKIQSPKESQSIKQQIRRKLAEVKFLICTIEDDSQKSLIDFYNQDCGQNYSPESFHSHNSDQTYQVQSERQAYQFSATKEQQLSIPNEQEGQIQIKYRRISPNSMEDISIYDTLDDQSETVECNAFQQRQSEKSINHLFSYEKEKTLDSPLPSISQRSSQYCSPSSKHSSHNQSLQFKKIYYLLQTSVKKEKANGHRLVSEFTPSKKQQKKKSLKINEQKDWDSCQQQLYQTINLLQTKYKRKVNVGVENIMDSLNMAIKQKNICLRTKK